MKKSILKVLVIDNSPTYTGAVKSILSVTDYLSSDVELILILPSQSLVKELRNKGYNVYRIPFLEIDKSWRLLVYFPILIINTIQTLRIIQKENIKILHVNDLYNMVGVLIKLFRPKIKLVQHIRLLPNSYVGFLFGIWSKLILRFADSIICVSKAVFTTVPHSSKKTIIYDALVIPEQLGLTKVKPFTFLYVGNYVKGKGHNYAIQAFRRAKKELVDCRLIFVGGDMGRKKNREYKENLIQKVRESYLVDKIEFKGFCEDLNHLYQSAHATLNFSESESFSMVCLESLLNGTPVIATKCGGPDEIIDHEIDGFLVTNRNVIEMSKAMVTIFKDVELRNRMSNNTFQVVNKFNIEKSALDLLNIYQSL
ncbi:MAG TPA: glycosyltransferase family 4 protein [Fulvivirga sp.]|nr:glycosyltransferase family 4 protein [Fulvivirga sp.]